MNWVRSKIKKTLTVLDQLVYDSALGSKCKLEPKNVFLKLVSNVSFTVVVSCEINGA